MKEFHIVGFDPEAYEDPKPVSVETWYDRHIRSWVSALVDEHGNQVGDAMFDGSRAGRDVSVAMLRRRLEETD